MKSVKYLTSQGELKRKDHSLIFRNDRGHVYIPIEGVKEIYCLNEVSLNSKLFDLLSKAVDLSQDSGHKKIKFFSAQQPFMECSTSQVDCQSEKSL